MVVGGKVASETYESFPVRLRLGEFTLPIERPAGLPETETVNMGYNRILESVKENEVETYNRMAQGEPQVYALRTKEVPIQYSATWKGAYLDIQGQIKILGRTISRGSPYEGKIPLAGIGYEAGGEFLGAMRGREGAGPAIETIINLPGIRSGVDLIEGSTNVPTGLWIGPESARLFGASISSRISGAINFLSEGNPELAALKLQAAESILPPEDVEVVRSIIDLRDITQRYPGLITIKEPFGAVQPISINNPETFRAELEYMDANAPEMRAYGSLVGRSYTGAGG